MKAFFTRLLWLCFSIHGLLWWAGTLLALKLIATFDLPADLQSNCAIYSLPKLASDDGYVIMMKSKYGWWPHFIWTADLEHFETFQPHEKKHRHKLPPILFYGKKITGSLKDCL
jgi:hypothetical protein